MSKFENYITKDKVVNYILQTKAIFKFIIFLTAYCILITQYSFSQTATATVKEKEYLIGDWIPVDLFVSASSKNKVAFPNLKDSISETIEVANFTPIDTVKKGGENQYHQLVNLIVFDTGQIMLPQFQFLVNNNGTLDSITSEAILVHVAGVKIDTSKDIIPIKEPLKIPYTFKEILPFAIGFVAFAILVGLLVWFIIKRKKKPVPIDEKYLLAPHVWAFKELEKLEKEKKEFKNLIRFLPHSPFFIIQDDVKVAVTGLKYGDLIYINRDLINQYLINPHAKPFTFQEALSILVHEFAHHLGQTDHQMLDQLGKRVASNQWLSTQFVPIDPRTKFLGAQLTSSQNFLQINSNLIFIDEFQQINMQFEMKNYLTCPIINNAAHQTRDPLGDYRGKILGV